MKLSVKKVDSLRREMHFEVPAERVTRKLDQVLSEIIKHAKVPGFRKGKAPKDIVKTAHAKVAREEMLKSLLPEVYQEGLKQENIEPIDFPMISDVDVKTDGILSFKATIDLKPEVQVKDYKGLKLSKKSADISDEEVIKALDFFKKSRGLDDNAVLVFDFAKGLGFPSLEELKKVFKANLEHDKQHHNRQDNENELIEALLKKAKLDLPKSLVERQLYGRLDDFRRRMKGYGAKDDDIEKRLKDDEKKLQEAAEKDVRLFLVLEKIAQLEGIKPEGKENLSMKVMEFLFKEAVWEEAKK